MKSNKDRKTRGLNNIGHHLSHVTLSLKLGSPALAQWLHDVTNVSSFCPSAPQNQDHRIQLHYYEIAAAAQAVRSKVHMAMRGVCWDKRVPAL